MSFVKVYVNSTPVRVAFNTSLIGAISVPSISIPRFCYHDKLNIAGNCRMCLVEIEKSPKPQASCALPVSNAIKAYTNTPIVKKAREGVLELLLVNHPLDCPICDQGGCCDLQDQAIKFGSKLSRFYIKKRGVEDKRFGVLIKTVINRCIHCTRCVRFASFVAGVEDLGTSLRGISTEIGTYVSKLFNSEVSANVIDLCPVGAKKKVKFLGMYTQENFPEIVSQCTSILQSEVDCICTIRSCIRFLAENNRQLNYVLSLAKKHPMAKLLPLHIFHLQDVLFGIIRDSKLTFSYKKELFTCLKEYSLHVRQNIK